MKRLPIRGIVFGDDEQVTLDLESPPLVGPEVIRDVSTRDMRRPAWPSPIVAIGPEVGAVSRGNTCIWVGIAACCAYRRWVPHQTDRHVTVGRKY